MARNRKERRQNPEVSPLGKTMPIAAERLRVATLENPERIIAVMWAEANTRENIRGYTVPIDSILHECSSRCGTQGHYFEHPKDLVSTPKDRDVRIIAATIQWIATNCGREFLGRFIEEISHNGCFVPKPVITNNKMREILHELATAAARTAAEDARAGHPRSF